MRRDRPKAFAIVRERDQIDELHDRTRPLPGRPGFRIDDEGRVWYSARWLDEVAS